MFVQYDGHVGHAIMLAYRYVVSLYEAEIDAGTAVGEAVVPILTNLLNALDEVFLTKDHVRLVNIVVSQQVADAIIGEQSKSLRMRELVAEADDLNNRLTRIYKEMDELG